ncbi:MAG: MltA domain-containing protein [Thiovulaceae bacterium]|nr:MltA domain-containing protein [Sulfurimonadaceae bacterium]
MRIFFYFLIAFFFIGCANTVEDVKPAEPPVTEKVTKAPELKQVQVEEKTKVQELQPLAIAKAEITKVEAVKIPNVKTTHALRVKSMKIKSSPLKYVSKDLSKTDDIISELPQNSSNISEVVQFDNENFDEVVDIFINNCKSATTRKMYGSLCDSALHVSDKKVFIKKNFKLYKIVDNQKDEGVLTGYYEPELHGSLTKHDKYIYPIYQKPVNMGVESAVLNTETNSSTIQNSSRADFNNLNNPALCYVDNKIDEFFLEIQGSGRVNLDTNKTLYVGYNGTNGQKYTSIGKYLIAKGYMSQDHMSLQDIKAWAHKNPDKIDSVLNQNARVVFFKKRDNTNVTGSLGIPLTPMRSVAVDSAYVPLGSMLLIDAQDYKHSIKNIVFAQDRGAAIKSAVRADLFTGYGKEALAIAGNLKAKLKMWIFLPKVQMQ